MNLYFLVEGRSIERKIYPQWLQYLLPDLKRVQYSDQVRENNYYLASGNGYPRILEDGLCNAIDKILETDRYDYFRQIFQAKNLVYTKKSPNQAQKQHYLEQLRLRVASNPEHLRTFQYFLDFCKRVQDDMKEAS
jgi:hypothetical protein